MNTITQAKPWLAAKCSRATWYRQQKRGETKPVSTPSRRETTPPPVTPAETKQKPRLRFNDQFLARARQKKNQLWINPFLPNPQLVMPTPKSQKLAMDSAISESNFEPLASWAGQGFNFASGEFTVFPGFVHLATLVQQGEHRRLAEIWSQELTRKFIKLSSTGDDDKTDRLKQLNDALVHFNIQALFRQAAWDDCVFGRSQIFIDLFDCDYDDLEELLRPIGDSRDEMSAGKVRKGSLRGFRTVEALYSNPMFYNAYNPLKPGFYEPDTWLVMGYNVDKSRLLTLVGRPVANIWKPSFAFAGMSLLLMADPVIRFWLRTRQSVNDLIHTFSVMVLKTDLSTSLSEGGEGVFQRADAFSQVRDNSNLMMVDKDIEDLENIAVPLGSLDHLQAQSQEHISAISGVPLVKLLGISPSGLNATSEFEIRVFYDSVHAFQETLFRMPLQTVINFISRHLWGKLMRTSHSHLKNSTKPTPSKTPRCARPRLK
jgi:uncharacterized protein